MTKKRPAPNWKIIREKLWKRSEGLCEVSGLPLNPDTFDAHHRRNKGMGGTYRPDTDSLSNLLALDPDVHNGGPQSVHGRRPWSEERGYLLPKDLERAVTWPVLIHGRRWVYLLSTGEYRDIPHA